MDKYTASNGFTIHAPEGDRIRSVQRADGTHWGYLSEEACEALREFFRAEEDERLGRWRWPEMPDYLVYHWGQPATAGVVVVCEVSGSVSRVLRRGADPENQSPDYRAARAYFDAHPEQSYTVAEWVAKAMYETPGGGEPGTWPPPHTDDKAYWLERAEAAIAKYEEIR